MKKTLLLIALGIVMQAFAFSQTTLNPAQERALSFRYTVSTPYLSYVNFGEEKTNTHHYELHLGYRLSPKDKIGIKLATWKLFAPMGMPMQEQMKFDESNFYPGRLKETGIGITYQRMIWKKLFVTAEILPQLKTYLDEDNKEICHGFKLYTSYHLGYQLGFFQNKIFLEPQIHCQYWPIETNAPDAFKEKDDEWNNYFLFEPNLYLGINFKY